MKHELVIIVFSMQWKFRSVSGYFIYLNKLNFSEKYSSHKWVQIFYSFYKMILIIEILDFCRHKTFSNKWV